MSCTRLYQRGRVVGLDGHTAHIVFEPLSGCSSCAGGCGFAQVATLAGAGRRTSLYIGIGPQSEFSVGDVVRVGIDARKLLWLVLITYILPLAGLLAGAVAVTSLLPVAGDMAALSGAIAGGLSASLLIIAFSGRRHSLASLGIRVTGLA